MDIKNDILNDPPNEDSKKVLETAKINTPPYKDLSHLSDDLIKNLMERYYFGNDKVKDLITEFELDVKGGKLYKLFPPQVHPDYLCPNCKTPMVTNSIAKTHRNTLSINNLYCLTCGHINNPYEVCNCKACNTARIEVEARRQAKLSREKEEIQNKFSRIVKYYEDSSNPKMSFDELTFRQKVYLGTFCRALLDESYTHTKQIQPLTREDSNHPISPNCDITRSMISELKHSNVLTVSSISPLEAFQDCDEFPKFHYLNKVWHLVNLDDAKDLDDMFRKILNPTYFNDSNKEIAYKMWFEIAKAECFNYLEFRLNAVGFDTNLGKKAELVFEELLKYFSVSQIYSIIWKQVASASTGYLEGRFDSNHAKNIAINGCERYGEKVREQGWDIPCFKRVKEVPESIYSEFFFYKVLKIDNMGFDIPPTFL